MVAGAIADFDADAVGVFRVTVAVRVLVIGKTFGFAHAVFDADIALAAARIRIQLS